MIRFAPWLLMASAASAAAAPNPVDLRDYALAECLIKQRVSTELRDEGYRLGEIVIYRARVSNDAWKLLARAVDSEFARRPMMTTHIDAPVAQSDKPIPLAHCLAVIEVPGVKAAMTSIQSRVARRHQSVVSDTDAAVP